MNHLGWGRLQVILYIVLGGCFFLFCLQNLETVSLRFLFWEFVSVSKLLLILISFAFGGIIGVLSFFAIQSFGHSSDTSS